ETLQKMREYSWPGNVRELENSIMRAVAMAGGAELLDERYLLQPPAAMSNDGGDTVPVLGGTMLSPRSAPSLPVNSDSGRAKSVMVSAAPAAPVVVGLGERVRPLRDVVADAE